MGRQMTTLTTKAETVIVNTEEYVLQDSFLEDLIDDTYNNNRKPINNSISSMPDLYSIKQWNQPNHHDYSKQDLYRPLKHVYNRKTYYGEQRLTLYIINHCSDSIDSYSYDNPRVCTYCYGEHHILFDTDHLKEDLESNRCDPWEQEQH